MRSVVLMLTVLALTGLGAQSAHAQSEDEKILEQGAATDDEAGPKQSKADDEMDDEELDEQVFYSGMGLERVSADFDNLGAATNIAGVIGFRIPTAPWFGLEIDLGQTIIPGTYRDPRPAGVPCIPPGSGNGNPPGCEAPAERGAADGAGDEFAMQALGIGLAFKSQGRFYVAGRYGYRYLLTSNDTLNEDRTGNGFGIAAGYRWGRGQSGVELGYKQLGPDVDSIGLNFFVRTARR